MIADNHLCEFKVDPFGKQSRYLALKKTFLQ